MDLPKALLESFFHVALHFVIKRCWFCIWPISVIGQQKRKQIQILDGTIYYYIKQILSFSSWRLDWSLLRGKIGGMLSNSGCHWSRGHETIRTIGIIRRFSNIALVRKSCAPHQRWTFRGCSCCNRPSVLILWLGWRSMTFTFLPNFLAFCRCVRR